MDSLHIIQKNSQAILIFLSFCLFLTLVEAKSGYHWFIGWIFLLSIPIFVGYLAWIDRDLLHTAKSRMQSFFLYAGVVLLTAIVVIMFGLLTMSQLKLWLNG